jgi:hypothetical protein
MAKLLRMFAFAICLPAAGAAAAGAGPAGNGDGPPQSTPNCLWDANHNLTQPCNVISVSFPNSNETVWTISRPDVRVRRVAFPDIKFKPGDVVSIVAGGCVQSGGSGATWHRYVNPRGPQTPVLYSGTVYIPGVIPLDSGNTFSGFQKISGVIGHPFEVKPDPTSGFTKVAPSLWLGFDDDEYDDNGYYSHDDGPGGQCTNRGAAWVQVDVVSNAPVARKWSSLDPKPFDYVYDTDEIDGNGLPTQPFWGAQLAARSAGKPAPLPDFGQNCGSAFNGPVGAGAGGTVYLTTLARDCTSQSPAMDLYPYLVGAGHCVWTPVGGHVDWTNATFTGTLGWSGWSGGWPADDDVNLNLLTPLNSAITTGEEVGGRIGLEFDKGETLDNFTNPFWAQADRAAELTASPFFDTAIANDLFDGKTATVTGVLGIDGVHGGYAEIHPVFALAVMIVAVPAGDGIDETWDYFIQNYGDGGGCSNGNEHLFYGAYPSNWYFLNIPRPKEAQESTFSFPATHDSQAGIAGPGVVKGSGWDYVGFHMPSPDTSRAAVDGELVVHYTLPAHFGLPPRDRTHHAVENEEDADWGDAIARIKDPALAQKTLAFFKANSPIVHAALPDAFVPVHTKDDDDVALQAFLSPAAADRERAREVASRPDPARKKAMDDFVAKLQAYMESLHVDARTFASKPSR